MAQARYDVVGIGSAIVDIISRADEDFLGRHGMTKGTMALMTAAQSKQLYDEMGHGVEMSGGSAANSMAGIASLGGKPAFIGKVGADKLGEIFSHEIKVVGVDFHAGAKNSTKLPTAVCLILVTSDAQRTMNTYLGACTEMGPDDIDADVISAADVTYIEGYQWDTPQAKAAIRKACTVAKGAGRKVALSLSDPFVVDRHRDDLLDLIFHHVDLIFGNEEEVFRLYRTNDFDTAVKKLRQSNTLACMTLGARGAVVVDTLGIDTVPAAPVKAVVDTTGAGDLFAAGFLYGYTHGRDLVRSAKIGAMAAAEIISHMGARPETPLRDLLRQHDL
ncbi:MAG: adenosine kinase [Rhodospirillaceae bacterium]|nr:adenosine kinase [Rhodospirillaceae bacterium]